MRLRAWLVGTLVIGVVLIGAAGASAATTTVGELALTPNGGNADLISPAGAPVFQGDASGNYALSSSLTGEITSWSFLSAGIAPGAQFELRVLAPATGGGLVWQATATSAPVTVSSAQGTDAVNGPFAVEIPITAGERIGLQPVGGDDTPIEMGALGSDGIRYFLAPFADSTTSTIVPTSEVDLGQVVPIQATVVSTQPPTNSSPPMITGMPVAAKTLTCDPGVWSIEGPYSYALTETTLVASVIKKHVVVKRVTTSLGNVPTVTLGDLPPGITTIGCAVTATDSAGSLTKDATPVKVQALRPVLARKLAARVGAHQVPGPNPTITPGVGAGAKNVCTSGRWVHYPTKYAYYWYAQNLRDVKQSVSRHPVVKGSGLIGKRAALVIPTTAERHRVFCVVQASNQAGLSHLAFSNRYLVHPRAPVNKAIPDVVGTVTAPAASVKHAILNPGALDGNDIFLGCGTGRWNRSDLKYTYRWLFDSGKPTQSPAPPLTGVIYTGNGILLKLSFVGTSSPDSYALKINNSSPLSNPLRLVDYLDDTVQCEVTATTPSGVSAVALSRSVHLAGPVVTVDNG